MKEKLLQLSTTTQKINGNLSQMLEDNQEKNHHQGLDGWTDRLTDGQMD